MGCEVLRFVLLDRFIVSYKLTAELAYGSKYRKSNSRHIIYCLCDKSQLLTENAHQSNEQMSYDVVGKSKMHM